MRKTLMILLFASLLTICTPAFGLEDQMVADDPATMAGEQMVDDATNEPAQDAVPSAEEGTMTEGNAIVEDDADLLTQSNKTKWPYLDWQAWDGNGALWSNDDYNVYRYTISSSSKVKFTGTFYMEQVRLELYDANCDRLWYDYYSWNANRGNIQVSETFDLVKGTYYLMVKKRNNHTGTYTMKTAWAADARETHAENEGGSNNSMQSASSVNYNAFWRGQIAINDDEDWFRFTLPSTGSITLTGVASMEQTRWELFDANGKRLWYDYYDWNKNTKVINISEKFDLVSGTYYLKVVKRNNRTGAYSIRTTYANASESFREAQGGSNNELGASSGISRNREYKGQIATNDECDWYRLSGVPSGKVRISGKFAMRQVRLDLYDANGDRVWYDYYDWNANTKVITVNEANPAAVGKGTYYLKVSQRNGYTGTYTFRVSDLYKNTLSVTTAKKSAAYSTVKSKAVAVAPFAVKKHAGAVTYAKVADGSAACLSVNKTTGKVTVKKGTKKGTYKIKVTIAAKGDYNHLKGEVTKVATVVVK